MRVLRVLIALLGCAIRASVGAGVYSTVVNYVVKRRFEPFKEICSQNCAIFGISESKLSLSFGPAFRSMLQLRGGSRISDVVVSPSLLASDWSDIRSEVMRCIEANVPHLHVDVFDGVFLNSPYALTFGEY